MANASLYDSILHPAINSFLVKKEKKPSAVPYNKTAEGLDETFSRKN